MALSSYWVSQKRKDLAERAIIARRERDALSAQKSSETASYYRDVAMRTTKYKSLEEMPLSRSARANEESCIKEKLKFEAKEKLEIRRQKLAHLSSIENEQFMKELKELRDCEREKDPWNISRLKEQIEDLQKKRKETELMMQKKFMHRISAPGLVTPRQNDEMLQREAAEAWQQRKEELDKRSTERLNKENKKSEILESEHRQAIAKVQEVEEEVREQRKQLVLLMSDKENRLREIEHELHKLRAAREMLKAYSETVSSLREKRDSIQSLHKRGFEKMQTMWQPKEKLRKMSNEIYHLLGLDDKLLSSLETAAPNMPFSAESSILPQINLESVHNLKDKIRAQVDDEKKRFSEIQCFYNEEAKQILGKYMNQWSAVSAARDDEMEQLFQSLSGEISSKLQLLSENEKQIISSKAEAMSEINETQKNSEEVMRNLSDKHLYFVDRAKRLGEEMESILHSNARPRSSFA